MSIKRRIARQKRNQSGASSILGVFAFAFLCMPVLAFAHMPTHPGVTCQDVNNDPDHPKFVVYAYKAFTYIETEVEDIEGGGTDFVITYKTNSYFLHHAPDRQNIEITTTRSNGLFKDPLRTILRTKFTRIGKFVEDHCDPVNGRPTYYQKAAKLVNEKGCLYLNDRNEPVCDEEDAAYDVSYNDRGEPLYEVRLNSKVDHLIKRRYLAGLDLGVIRRCYNLNLQRLLDEGVKHKSSPLLNSFGYTYSFLTKWIFSGALVPDEWEKLKDCGGQAERMCQMIQSCSESKLHLNWNVKIAYYQRVSLLNDTYTHKPEYYEDLVHWSTMKEHYLVVYSDSDLPMLVMNSYYSYLGGTNDVGRADFFTNGFPDFDDNSPYKNTLLVDYLVRVFQADEQTMADWATTIDMVMP